MPPVPTADTCPGPIFSLAAILRLLVACFAAQAPRTFPPGALLVEAIWRRIHRLGAQLRRFAKTEPRRAAPPTSELAREITAKTAPGATQARPRREPDPLTAWRVTREHGWLVSMMGNLAPAAQAFEQFLQGTDPDDLLDADPRFAGLLRRLGWMLGVNPDLLPPSHRPDPIMGPLDPGDLRPAPRGFARSVRVNQLGYERLEARLCAAAEPPAPDLAENSA